MRWINDTTARYYQAHLSLDLLGDWTLIAVWGGLGSKRGNMRVNHVPSYEDGLKRLQDLDKRRQRRGYQPVSEKVQTP
jgi:predicted DNA-binding WGR domain protein